MQRFIKSCLYGGIGGIILYVVDIFCSSLAYMKISGLWFDILLDGSIIFGGVIAIFTILYKNTSLIQMVGRFVMLLVSFFGIMLLNGYIGTVRFLYDSLNTNNSSSSDNISGMLTLTFLTIVVGISIFTILVMTVIRIYTKVKQKGN